MQRFLLFAGSYKVPAGGWCDFVRSGDNVQDLAREAKARDQDGWWHIVDSTTARLATDKYADLDRIVPGRLERTRLSRSRSKA